MIGFVIAGLVLALVAVLALLWPLLRARRGGVDGGLQARRKALQGAFDAGVLSREEFEAKRAALEAEAPAQSADVARPGAKHVLVAIAVVLPLAAVGLYAMLGRPDAVSISGTPTIAGMSAAMPASSGMPATDAAQKPGMDMSAAIDSLRAKLDKNPADADGWLLLGRAYESMGRNADGRQALEKAYALAKDRPAIEIAYAEALALASPERRIDGKPLEMIRHALQVEPDNQDGLWLLGMSDYQQGRYAEAIASWEKIRVQLGPDSDVLQSVTGMIADARAHLPGGDAAAVAMPAAGGASMPAAASQGGTLRLRVTLADALRAKAAPGDAVFVFAKAVGGPPMPVAIKRLQVSALPADIELGDADAMVPTMRLSNFPKVSVAARVSKSGDASPHTGDLQAAPVETATANANVIAVSIDSVVP